MSDTLANKLASDTDFGKAAKAFFLEAKACAASTNSEAREIFKSGAFSMYAGVVFRQTPELRKYSRDLILRATKLMGPAHGNEDDIASIAWNYIATGFLEDDFKPTVKALAENLASPIQPTTCVFPNYAVRLTPDLDEVSIGPVSILRGSSAHQWLNEQTKTTISRMAMTTCLRSVNLASN
jgi:hypothetical protein